MMHSGCDLSCIAVGRWGVLYDRVARQYIPASTPTLGLSPTSPPPWDYLELPPYRRELQTPETSAHSLSFSCNLCENLFQDIACIKNHIRNSHSPGIGELPPRQLICLQACHLHSNWFCHPCFFSSDVFLPVLWIWDNVGLYKGTQNSINIPIFFNEKQSFKSLIYLVLVVDKSWKARCRSWIPEDPSVLLRLLSMNALCLNSSVDTTQYKCSAVSQ